MTPECFVALDLDTAEMVEGDREVSSLGKCIHVPIYRRRPDVKSIIHVHSEYATALSEGFIISFHLSVTVLPTKNEDRRCSRVQIRLEVGIKNVNCRPKSSRYYAEACNEWRGLHPWLNA